MLRQVVPAAAQRAPAAGTLLPHCGIRATPVGVTISALSRSIGVPLDDHIVNLVRFFEKLA